MKVEMGALSLGIDEPMLIDKITLDEGSGEIHLHFNFQSEGRLLRFDRDFEDLPVGGI